MTPLYRVRRRVPTGDPCTDVMRWEVFADVDVADPDNQSGPPMDRAGERVWTTRTKNEAESMAELRHKLVCEKLGVPA